MSEDADGARQRKPVFDTAAPELPVLKFVYWTHGKKYT